MTLTKAWDSSVLSSSLKSASLADAPKIVGGLFSALFSWIAASLVFLASSNPVLSIVGSFVPAVVQYLMTALAPSLPGLLISITPMTLSKAWDTAPLEAALKALEVPNVVQLLIDDANVLFAWVQASLALGSVLEQGIAPIVASVAVMVDTELKALAAKI